MQHDGGVIDRQPATVVTTWPKGSFAESIAVDRAGTIFVSLHTDRAVVAVDPVSGSVSPFARFDRPATGLAFLADGSLMVSGGVPGQALGLLWRVARNGDVAVVSEFAEAAFLNGMTPYGDLVLVCDSLAGVIHACDPASGQVTPWLADALLRPSAGDPSPGANGIKLFGNAATISVTSADRLVRVPLRAGSPGPLAVVAERLRADDFYFAVDGTALIATHPAQSLVRLDPDGMRATVATAQDGMVGATAVAFGRMAADRTCAYVTATGGTMTLPDERLEPAKLVRVDVGLAGYGLLPETA